MEEVYHEPDAGDMCRDKSVNYGIKFNLRDVKLCYHMRSNDEDKTETLNN